MVESVCLDIRAINWLNQMFFYSWTLEPVIIRTLSKELVKIYIVDHRPRKVNAATTYLSTTVLYSRMKDREND